MKSMIILMGQTKYLVLDLLKQSNILLEVTLQR